MDSLLPGAKASKVIERERNVVGSALQVRFYPLVVDRAEGVVLWDVDGNSYLDFSAGAAVACTGYGHPKVVSAIKNELDKLTHHCFTLASNEVTVELAENLLKLLGREGKAKVWYGLSGGDANECVYKLVPDYTKKRRIISFMGSYQGMTMGSLSLSGHKALQKFIGFANVIKVPYPYCYRCPFKAEYPECGLMCVDFIESQVMQSVSPPEDTSCIVVEPIQSDSGEVVPPDDFMPHLKKLCEKYGIYLAVDEIKSGFGRTGEMFAFQHSKVSPEIITMAKPIASGMPLSACVAPSEILDASVGSHLMTTAGHPVACAAALATLEVIREEKLVENAATLGDYMKKRLAEMKEDHPLIGEVRGKGLMMGVELVKDQETKEPAAIETAKLTYHCWEKGLIVINLATFANVIEITPPLVLTRELAEDGLGRFEEALTDVEKGKVPDERLGAFKAW
jgi:4-aminobutyrate aminotransferase